MCWSSLRNTSRVRHCSTLQSCTFSEFVSISLMTTSTNAQISFAFSLKHHSTHIKIGVHQIVVFAVWIPDLTDSWNHLARMIWTDTGYFCVQESILSFQVEMVKNTWRWLLYCDHFWNFTFWNLNWHIILTVSQTESTKNYNFQFRPRFCWWNSQLPVRTIYCIYCTQRNGV